MFVMIFKIIVILWVIHVITRPRKHSSGLRPLKNKGNTGGGAGGFG